jgi:hypothetical protein
MHIVYAYYNIHYGTALSERVCRGGDDV